MDLSSVLTSASAAHALGRLDECNALCDQALALDVQNIQAKLLKGVIAAKSGKPAEAVEFLEDVQAADPRSFQAPFWLSVAYRGLGQKPQAILAAERATSISPNDSQAQAQLGVCYLDARLLPKAETWLRNASGAAPDVLVVHCSLGHCLALQGRRTEARLVIQSALDRIEPTEEQLLRTGHLLLSQEFALGAVEFGRRAVAIAPNSAKARLLLARALTELDGAEAVEQFRVAVSLDPTNAEATSMLGAAFQAIGHIEEASKQFRRSLQLEPNQGYAYFALFNNRTVTEDDRPALLKVQELVDQKRFPPRQLSYLHYGSGKAHENLGEYGEAMLHYDQANRIEYELKFRDRLLDRGEIAARTDRTISLFDKRTFERNENVGSDRELPIFVVGMMRSGTTLAEQILSSHPEVGGAGEQRFWPDNWRQAMNETGTEVEPEDLRMLADRYCALLEEISPGKSRVVDKLPGNTFGLGLIHLAFPRARIIHMRRHPVDTCLSIYTTPNRSLFEFAHNRENIVFGYGQYRRIMDHWRTVLPLGQILEVDYEQLVNDSERTTRQMIQFCGLDWNDACLKPEDNARQVITPSVWQVRQPIYKSSTERWRNFEPWLGPFHELL